MEKIPSEEILSLLSDLYKSEETNEEDFLCSCVVELLKMNYTFSKEINSFLVSTKKLYKEGKKVDINSVKKALLPLYNEHSKLQKQEQIKALERQIKEKEDELKNIQEGLRKLKEELKKKKEELKTEEEEELFNNHQDKPKEDDKEIENLEEKQKDITEEEGIKKGKKRLRKKRDADKKEIDMMLYNQDESKKEKEEEKRKEKNRKKKEAKKIRKKLQRENQDKNLNKNENVDSQANEFDIDTFLKELGEIKPKSKEGQKKKNIQSRSTGNKRKQHMELIDNKDNTMKDNQERIQGYHKESRLNITFLKRKVDLLWNILQNKDLKEAEKNSKLMKIIQKLQKHIDSIVVTSLNDISMLDIDTKMINDYVNYIKDLVSSRILTVFYKVIWKDEEKDRVDLNYLVNHLPPHIKAYVKENNIPIRSILERLMKQLGIIFEIEEKPIIRIHIVDVIKEILKERDNQITEAQINSFLQLLLIFFEPKYFDLRVPAWMLDYETLRAAMNPEMTLLYPLFS